MSRFEELPKELPDLIFRSLSGDITEPEFRRLDEILSQSDPAIEYYLEFVAVTTGLVDMVGVLPEPVQLLPQAIHYKENLFEETLEFAQVDEDRQREIEVYARQQLEAFLTREHEKERSLCADPGSEWSLKEHLLDTGERLADFWHAGVRVAKTGLAACVGIGIVIITALYVASHGPVATLVESSHAKWSTPIEEGQVLKRQTLVLEEGYARIELNKGAKVLVQAPSEITLKSPNRIYMERGWVTAKVPNQASGFTIQTPTSKVVDFGTEFGLLVGARDCAEMHVFTGEVAVESDMATTTGANVFRQGDVALVNSLGLVEREVVKDRPSLFTREIPLQNTAGIPGKRLCLADMVGGGNGLGLGVIGQGIDPVTGTLTDEFSMDDDKGQGFIQTPNLLFVDGVFVPDGNRVPVEVSSSGTIFPDCPPTSGLCFDTIKFGAKFIRTGLNEGYHPGLLAGHVYDTMSHPSIGIHPNAGITFDLHKIRSVMSNTDVTRFTALCGTSDTIIDALEDPEGLKVKLVQFWVLVDGHIRFTKNLSTISPEQAPIDIPLGKEDQYLTLMTTCIGDNGMAWAMFAMPSLELARAK